MSEPNDQGTDASRVYRNGAIAVVIAWSMRAIGLVSVFVLARTLTPADFGIVALAMATLAMVDMFSALGLKQALLRVREPDPSHYNTVWTIQLLVLTFLAFVVAALGPVMAWFYSEPALTWVIIALATRFVFFGLANIGIVEFDRNLELERDLKFRLTVRLSTFVVTLSAAFLLRNYWALVIGGVFQGAIHCVASYFVHPFRPRFSLQRKAEMLSVSLWMFLTSAAQTVQSEMERIVVGRISSLGTLGYYSVSKGLSSIFTDEVATALNRVTFVTTANSGKRLGEAPDRLQSMLGTYALIAAPLGLGLAATAPNTVYVLLGEQWGQAIPFLQLIAPAAALYAVSKLVISSLQASGKAKLAAKLALASAGTALATIALIVIMQGGALDVATGILVTNGLALAAGIIVLTMTEKINAAATLLATARPFLAALIMLAVVSQGIDATEPSIVMLAAQVIAGAVLYLTALIAIWLSCGKPDGAEAASLNLLKSWLDRRLVQNKDAAN